MLGCCYKLILDVILMISRCLLFIMKFTKAVPKTAATPTASKAALKAALQATTPAAPKAALQPKPPKAPVQKKNSKASQSKTLGKRTGVDSAQGKPPPKVTLFS